MSGDRYQVLEDEKIFRDVLNKGMFYANSFVNKFYLIGLNQYPVAAPEDGKKSDDFIRLFHISRIVYDRDEIANDKLISVYSAIYNIQATSILVIKSHGHVLDFYLGVRSDDNASTAEAILQKSLRGNFPGSVMDPIPKQQITDVLSDVNSQGRFGCEMNVASVSIVPSTRDEDKTKFVQGIEKFIDTMRGEDYTAIILAEPVSKAELEQRKQGLLSLRSTLTPFETTQLSYGTSESKAVTKGLTKTFSDSVNSSITETNGNFHMKNHGFSTGASYSFFGLSLNSSFNIGSGTGNSFSTGETRGDTRTEGTSEQDSTTDTTGSTRTITLTSQNRAVTYIGEKIEQHLKRIRNCESFGMWDVACYFVSGNIQTSVVAASTYKALMSGFDSGAENSYVNVWSSQDQDRTPKVLESLRYCMHPVFEIPENTEAFYTDSQFVTPSCMVSGNELPYIMGLPAKSVQGVTVLSIAEFGRNVMYTKPQAGRRKQIRLGQVFHMGREEGTPVMLDLQSLTSHCFITGSTGSGKSNTVYRILDEMISQNIPFLVIEPAKGEYKRCFGALPGINIYCTNPGYFSMLKVNPFRFPDQVHVLEHLDRLIEIFNACWPLYAAMPAILKDAFEQSYVRCGWDLDKSIHIPNDRPKYPTFRDIMEILPQIINSSAYSSDSKGDYTGSLVTRVKSLTNGITGQVMCADDDISDEELFDQNTIVDLSRVSSAETKSLLMGVMILKLNEHRMCTSKENQPLRHITVLEEAHNILKRTGGARTGQDSADVQGKSVEMISASIAEMRTYGEGFIIVDQSPTAVDVSAIKNTNTKVIMRLPDFDDCQIAGRSIGLSDDQIHEISRFPLGVAAVFQNNWTEAVLTKVDRSQEKYHREDEIVRGTDMAEVRGRLAAELITDYECGYLQDGGNFELTELQAIIRESEITDSKKKELYSAAARLYFFFEENPGTRKNFSVQLARLMDCDGLFALLQIRFSRSYAGTETFTKEIIDKKDRQAIIRWYKDLDRYIDDYVYISDRHMKNRLLYYLIFSKRARTMKYNKYKLIMAQLYGRSKA